MKAGMPEVKLDDLYQEVILDHNKNPRNFTKLSDANLYSHGYNPLCGDDYELYLLVDQGGHDQKSGFSGAWLRHLKIERVTHDREHRGKERERGRTFKEQFCSFID